MFSVHCQAVVKYFNVHGGEWRRLCTRLDWSEGKGTEEWGVHSTAVDREKEVMSGRMTSSVRGII